MSDVTQLYKELVEARAVLKKAEESLLETSATKMSVLVRVKELLAISDAALLQEWSDIEEESGTAQIVVTAARKNEKAAHEALSIAAEKEALYLHSQEKPVFGRNTIHPNIEIIRETVIKFPENPYEFGAVVTELIQKGKRDLITIKTHGSTSWFVENRSSLIQIQEQPAVRIDGIKTSNPDS